MILAHFNSASAEWLVEVDDRWSCVQKKHMTPIVSEGQQLVSVSYIPTFLKLHLWSHWSAVRRNAYHNCHCNSFSSLLFSSLNTRLFTWASLSMRSWRLYPAHSWVIVNKIITMLITAANTYVGAIISVVSTLSRYTSKGSLVSQAPPTEWLNLLFMADAFLFCWTLDSRSRSNFIILIGPTVVKQ